MMVHGTFSTVYKGTWNDKTVAVKKFLIMHRFSGSLSDQKIDGEKKRFEREMNLQYSLKHPNIVEVHMPRMPSSSILYA